MSWSKKDKWWLGVVRFLPIILILDMSSSMTKELNLLMKCMWKTVSKLKLDPVISYNAAVLAVAFNHNYRVLADFEPLEKLKYESLEIPECVGATDPGKALLYALGRVDEVIEECKKEHEKTFAPVMIYFTDGYPDAGRGASDLEQEEVENNYRMAAELIQEREKNGKLVFVAAGLERADGAGANMEKIKELTSYPQYVQRIREQDELDYGRWADVIHSVVKTASQNTPVARILQEVLDPR